MPSVIFYFDLLKFGDVIKLYMVILSTLILLRACSYSTRNMTEKVFVYGTLKRNEPNHDWLTDKTKGISKFVCEGVTKTKYPLIIATKYNIPFLLYNPGDGLNVKGEIYEVDEKMLGNLDILEDHPNFYIREIDDIIVQKRNGTETIQAWVYFLKKFKRNLLSRDMMENYSSTGPHGLVYKERSQRDPNYDHKLELKE